MCQSAPEVRIPTAWSELASIYNYAAAPMTDHRRRRTSLPLSLDQRLDGAEDGCLCERLVEPFVRRRALADQQVDCRRVTGLDLHDRAGRGQHLLALQRRRRAVVRTDTCVLENRRECQERLFTRRRERERRFRGGLAAELLDRRSECRDVRGLLCAELLRVLLRFATEAKRLSLDVVEVRLEVLERQREVENFNVAPTRFGECLRDERRDRRSAIERTCRKRATQDERRARHAVHLARCQLRAGDVLISSHICSFLADG